MFLPHSQAENIWDWRYGKSLQLFCNKCSFWSFYSLNSLSSPGKCWAMRWIARAARFVKRERGSDAEAFFSAPCPGSAPCSVHVVSGLYTHTKKKLKQEEEPDLAVTELQNSPHSKDSERNAGKAVWKRTYFPPWSPLMSRQSFFSSGSTHKHQHGNSLCVPSSGETFIWVAGKIAPSIYLSVCLSIYLSIVEPNLYLLLSPFLLWKNMAVE